MDGSTFTTKLLTAAVHWYTAYCMHLMCNNQSNEKNNFPSVGVKYVSSKYRSTGDWALAHFRMRMPNNSENQCFPVAQSFDFSFYLFAYLTMLFSHFYFSCSLLILSPHSRLSNNMLMKCELVYPVTENMTSTE